MKTKNFLKFFFLGLAAVSAGLLTVIASVPTQTQTVSILTAQVFTGEPAPPAPAPEPSPAPAPEPAPAPAPEPSPAPQPEQPPAQPPPPPPAPARKPSAPKPAAQPAAQPAPEPQPEPEPEPEPEIAYLQDSDNDGFSDRIENENKTDPQNPDSSPQDENRNKIDDAWEQRYGLTPDNGSEDTDGDGVSDKLEYSHGTDPLKEDSDNDTFSDSQEILELLTNPNDAESPGTLEKLGVRITGFNAGQLLGDPQPFIKGIAPKDSTVQIAIFDAQKQERILGETLTHENNIFFFLSPELLEDGDYDFVARVIQKPTPETGALTAPLSPLTPPIANAQDLAPTPPADTTQPSAAAPEKPLIIMESKPVRVKINKALGVIPPNPKKLADKEVTEENFLKDLRVEIIDNQPVLFGRTAYNSEVVATWHSIVMTSALIADTPKGEFSISAFHPLGEGNHEVYVQAIRLRDSALSKTIKVPFTIIKETFEVAPEKLKPAAPAAPAAPETAVPETATAEQAAYTAYFWPLAVLAAVLLLAFVALALLLTRKKKDTHIKKQKNPPSPKPPSETGSAHFLQ